MPTNSLDLTSIFSTVTHSLEENKQSLNQADEYNQDHGNNMVQTFQTITAALEKKKGASDSTALNYAAKQLSRNTSSGSSKLYAEHLSQAASQVKGKSLDAGGAIQLLQTLIGASQSNQPAGQQPAQGGDMLGSLLGGLMGGGQTEGQQPAQGGGDLLSSLLGGLTGGGQTEGQQPAQGGGDLLGSLLGGLMGGGQTEGQQPAQGGGDLLGSLLSGLVSGGGLQSLAQAFTNKSHMGDASHRTQSTQVVVQSFLQALTSQGGK